MELKILHDNYNYYLNFQNNISYIIFDKRFLSLSNSICIKDYY